jgi:hypothetical protein
MRVPLQVHAFRKLLVQETDETKRQMLFLSLAQEGAQLKAQLRALGAKCGPELAGSSYASKGAAPRPSHRENRAAQALMPPLRRMN